MVICSAVRPVQKWIWTFWQLQKELGDTPEGLWESVKSRAKRYRKPERVGVKAPDEQILQWFTSRKISPETVTRFKIRQTPDGEIAFPYFKDGQLVNVKYRRLPKAFRQEKDAEPCLFGRDLIGRDADQLLIVEGEVDVMAAWEYGIEAVSVPVGVADTRWIET